MEPMKTKILARAQLHERNINANSRTKEEEYDAALAFLSFPGTLQINQVKKGDVMLSRAKHLFPVCSI